MDEFEKLEKYTGEDEETPTKASDALGLNLDDISEDELMAIYAKLTGKIREKKQEKKQEHKEKREQYFVGDEDEHVATIEAERDENGLTVTDYLRKVSDEDDDLDTSLKDLFDNVRRETGIRVDEDGMHAYLYMEFSESTQAHFYTEEEINVLIHDSGINTGVMKEELERAINDHQYNEEVLIAQGKPAVDGIDGHFEFYFNEKSNNVPREKSDGSIDYRNVYNFEFVKENQKIAEYIPATNGTYGVTVFGQLIKPKQGKNLQRLHGKGFRIEENTYYSNMHGMIELRDGDSLYIDNVLEVKSDVDYSVGNIEFDGDVMVRGSLMRGFEIKATGNVIVEGVVEGATIESERDIVLRSGMTGDGIGTLKAGGTIVGRFFERVNIECKEDLFCDYLLNCNVSSMGVVMVRGKDYTGIIGGNVRALMGVDSDIIGNEIEIKTHVSVGVDKELVKKHNQISKQINTESDVIKSLDQKIKVVKDNPDKAEYCLDLLKQRIKSDKLKTSLMDELYELKRLMANSTKAAIAVGGIMYPRTTIEINGQARFIKEQMRRVLITLDDGKLQYYKYTDNVVARNLNDRNKDKK